MGVGIGEEQRKAAVHGGGRELVDPRPRTRNEGQVVHSRAAALMRCIDDVRTRLDDDVVVCPDVAGPPQLGITPCVTEFLKEPAERRPGRGKVPNPDLHMVKATGMRDSDHVGNSLGT